MTQMKEITTIEFVDVETRDRGLVIVRASANKVGLALSLRSDGDLEVFLSRDDCETLISALQRAIVQQTS